MARPELRGLQPQHEHFIGIDSDGCVFPTMELKHRECFIPATIRLWQLQPICGYVREAAEFVNLYSRWRGENRFPALLRVFDYLRERPEVVESGVVVPELPALREWIVHAPALGNPALRREIDNHPDPELIRTLKWSEAVNNSIAEMVVGVPPFPGVEAALGRMVAAADIVVVSGTPARALEREWREHDIARYVRLIAGQERGAKAEQLDRAASGRYAAHKMLMIGDAPGDLSAAREVGASFYPIIPGRERRSWKRLLEQDLDRFLAGGYAGKHENRLIEEFNHLLPDRPPWNRIRVKRIQKGT